MTDEKQAQHEIKQQAGKNRWLAIIAAFLAAALVAQTAYMTYLVWGMAATMGRIYGEFENSEAFAQLDKAIQELDIDGEVSSGSLTPASKEELRDMTKGLGEALSPDAQPALEGILDMALQRDRVDGEALDMAEDPLGKNQRRQEARRPAPERQLPDAQPLNELFVEEYPGRYHVRLHVAEFDAEEVHASYEDGRLVVLALGKDGRAFLERTVELDEPVLQDSLRSEVKGGRIHVTILKEVQQDPELAKPNPASVQSI